MTRVPLIEWDEASPEVRKVYAEIIKLRKEGTVSKSFRTRASNIHVLRARLEMTKILLYSETLLPHKLKEAIQMVVSKTVGCGN